VVTGIISVVTGIAVVVIDIVEMVFSLYFVQFHSGEKSGAQAFFVPQVTFQSLIK
jgi:hypothetical protein